MVVVPVLTVSRFAFYRFAVLSFCRFTILPLCLTVLPFLMVSVLPSWKGVRFETSVLRFGGRAKARSLGATQGVGLSAADKWGQSTFCKGGCSGNRL